MKKATLVCLTLLILFVPFCTRRNDRSDSAPAKTDYAKQRENMVVTQIEARGVKAPLVLAAMRKVPRHLFVQEEYRDRAYEDHPLPIGHGQTISQPYIVALMTELMELKGGEKVLEVGTGSGYQAAVLAEIAADVYTIEIIEPLGLEAKQRLKEMGYNNIHVRFGDGYKGWPDVAPFDAIIVTAAPPQVPPPLIAQLKVGALLVIPVGENYQQLMVYTRTETAVEEKSIIPVRFVPMTGEAQDR